MHPSPASTTDDRQPPPTLKVTSRLPDGAERSTCFRDEVKRCVWKNIVPPTPSISSCHSSPQKSSSAGYDLAGVYPTPISDEEPSPPHKRRRLAPTTTSEAAQPSEPSMSESAKPSQPSSESTVIEIELGDWLTCGDIADILVPRIVDTAIHPACVPRQGLVAKTCTPGYYNYAQGKYLKDAAARMIESEAGIYASLAALQGKAIPRFYGLWHGEYRRGDRLINEMYIMLLEDVGAPLEAEGPMVPRRRNKHVHNAYNELHAAGIVHRSVDTMHICTREPDPDRAETQDSTSSDSVCLVDFTLVLTAGDQGYAEALESEKLYLDAWLPTERTHV